MKPSLQATQAEYRMAADSYDVSVKRGGRPWRAVAVRLPSPSYRVQGKSRGRVRVRVRARNVDGDAGAWTAPRTLAFGR